MTCLFRSPREVDKEPLSLYVYVDIYRKPNNTKTTSSKLVQPRLNTQ